MNTALLLLRVTLSLAVGVFLTIVGAVAAFPVAILFLAGFRFGRER